MHVFLFIVPGEEGTPEAVPTPVISHHEYCIPAKVSTQQSTNSISTQTEVTASELDQIQKELQDLKERFADKDSLFAELFMEKTVESPKNVKVYYGLPNKGVFDGKYHFAN